AFASKRSPRNAMKKSSDLSVRVSVTMFPISPPGSPDRIRPPTVSATQPTVRRSSSPNPRPETPRFQRLPRDRHVVERQRHAADLLVLLVPLARNQHDVAGLGLRDGVQDRFAAIDDRCHLGAPLPRLRLRATAHLVDDPRRVLASR